MHCPICGSVVPSGAAFCAKCGADVRALSQPQSPPVTPTAPASGWSAEGWYAGRKDGASEWKGGPYTWEQLTAFIAEGRIGTADLVWHESLPDWVPAGSVPGLTSAPPTTTGQPSSSVVPAQRAAAPRGRGPLVGLSIVAALLVLAGVGAGVWAWTAGPFAPHRGNGPSLGIAQVTVPDPAKLITTTAYGEVPADQIGVMLKDGASRQDAETVAKSLGGSLVGEIEYVNTFQIQFPGSTESDLKRALATAKSNAKVAGAFANQQVYSDAEIKGVRVSPDDDPVYDNGVGDGYKALGFAKAWSYIRGSGIKLSDAHVGVVDEGLFRTGQGKENEFGGDAQIDFPDPSAGEVAAPVHTNGSANANPAGSHGTGVATIIGADADNGGPVGIAGPLGKKLRISMIDRLHGQYGTSATSAPDPNDPTKQVWSDGKTYTLGALVALTKQVEAGSKVINCSWGNPHADPLDVASYKRFFEKMAADHPDVVFVCSAGNTGAEQDGATRTPGGLALPNIITVGAVNNDGTLANYSTRASGNYEVTLDAPGTGAVVGLSPNGGAIRQNGTSFSTPEVTGAIAVLQAINPDLSAGEIKDILVSAARQGTTVGEPGKPGYHTNLAPPEVGGRVLALDRAVLKVINDERAGKNLAPLTPELLEKMGVIDAVAKTDKPGEYIVKGIVGAVGEQGTDVTIDVTGENHAVGGSTTQKLTGPGEVTWDVTLPKDSGTILVKRLDNGAASLITIESFNINGKWSGTFTVTDVTVTDEEAAKAEGCGAALYSALKGKALPMTMDVTADESGNGSADILIDVSSLNKNGEGTTSSEPQRFGLTYAGSTVTFDVSGSKGVTSMSGEVSRGSGDDLVMKGLLTGGGKGWSIRAVFSVMKPGQ